MRRTFVVYDRYMDHELQDVSIGGVQTYITALAQLMSDIGMDVHIVQSAAAARSVALPYATVHGLDVAALKRPQRLKAYHRFALAQRGGPDDIIVWASFYDAIPSPGLISIGIQHGIAFDYLGNDGAVRRLAKRWQLNFLLKWWQRRVALRAFDRSQYRVCVDYNFLNWYRTFEDAPSHTGIDVIPNFTDIVAARPGPIAKFRRIIFARRFVEPRGAALAIEAAEHLLRRHADIEFTFAGDGNLKDSIDRLAAAFPGRIKVIRYKSEESLAIHREHDIAIVPTLGSEGTSLSLLEAMAAGCAVVCTNVGGMTNIVIDRFNGLMINPGRDELIAALEALYTDSSLANQLVVNAQNTVVSGFSKSLWRAKWANLLNKIAGIGNNFPLPTCDGAT